MSDLADRCAESCEAVSGAGGRFVSGRAGPSRMVSRDCGCGGRPQWQAAGRGERLVCAGCGNGVGPGFSRQTLAAEWNQFGYAVGGSR